MGGLRAALYKDGRLFFQKAGLAVLVLPLVLLFALRAGMGDLSAQIYVQPFPIGVRDLDSTMMSRSLVSQMRQIDLFSQVYTLKEGEPDALALDRGAAAVVTIPKDFFYDLYTMEDCPVEVVLNGERQLEAALFSSIFQSVMDIIRANQTAGLGVYRFCYGELTGQVSQDMYAKTSQRLIQDALGRQMVFDAQAQKADLQGALERRLLATVLAVLALSFSVSAVKTLPEERRLGVLPRFRGIGGSLAAFVASKLLAALLLALPTAALMGWLFSRETLPLFFLTAFLMLAGAFGLLLALSAWVGSAAAVQRWGNALLLASLVLGGTLWPRQLLPGPLAGLGKLTLPYYGSLALEGISRGAGIRELLALLWPLWAMGLAGLALALAGLSRRPSRREGGRASGGLSAPLSAAPARGILSRFLALSRFKGIAMAGGAGGLAAALTLCLLCGGAAAWVRQGGAGKLRLAVLDLDNSPLSRALIQQLETRPGLSVLPCEGEADQALFLGDAEGLLTIQSGYGRALEAGETPLPLSYEGAASSLSVQGARELVAGQVAVQRSRLRAPGQAEQLLGRELSPEEEEALLAQIEAEDRAMPPLYRLNTREGTPPPQPFLPSPVGFAALAVLFTLLTAAPWSGGDGRRVEERMLALPWGRLLSYGSDCLALTGLGLLAALAALAPSKSLGPWELAAAGAYAFCGAALALVLTRMTAQEGRVDALAPTLSLILCLLGGCFLDVAQLSPTMARLALCTPPGLALAASGGNAGAAAVLTVAGLVLFLIGMPRKQR